MTKYAHLRMPGLLAAVFLGSCASIPAESVELSKLVGEMVSAAKVSHVNLVNLHFDHLLASVDQFAYGDYKAAFLGNVRKLCKEKDPDFKELTLEQYDRALMRVHKVRNEWANEVQKNRREVLQALEEHYAVLLQANAEVTSLLKSAADLSETRAALLQRFGEKIGISGTKVKELEDKLAEGTKRIDTLLEAALGQIKQ